MDSGGFAAQLSRHISYLYGFTRQMNELDFAISLSGEFRGAQDIGWSTTITANEVFNEILAFTNGAQARSKPEFRTLLMLYCQLAEAGGVYESIKNVMGVVARKPYLLWPFKDLVRVGNRSRQIIGPNANATFRDLAATADAIGMKGLSELLEIAFRDDLRNGVAHADYVIWSDGVRLPKRNGGNAMVIPFAELNNDLSRGVAFFQILLESNRAAMQSYACPKTIVGKLSANPPMRWTVSYTENGGFGISGSSPGPVTSPEFVRQQAINEFLGGKVLAIFITSVGNSVKEFEDEIVGAGFDPHLVVLPDERMLSLSEAILKQDLWDYRSARREPAGALLLTPWGFTWLSSPSEFYGTLPSPITEFEID